MIEYLKKHWTEILQNMVVILVAALIILSYINTKQTGEITRLSRDNAEQKHIIGMAFQKSQGNVYTDNVRWDNGTLYIPVLYRGAVITLATTNYSTYQSYDMGKLYRWIDAEYYSGNYPCVGVNVIVAGADSGNPFSPDYRYGNPTCTGEGTWINLDAPLDSNNGGTSGRFRLGG